MSNAVTYISKAKKIMIIIKSRNRVPWLLLKKLSISNMYHSPPEVVCNIMLLLGIVFRACTRKRHGDRQGDGSYIDREI